MIEQKLFEYIKQVIASGPSDIVSEEFESISHSSFELVEPREIDEDEDEEEDDEEWEDLSRYIGSVNLFIAAALVCDEVTQGRSLQNLNKTDSAKFESAWRSVINQLKDERFIRETQPVAHSKIKLVVDNDKLPNIGA